VVLGPLLDVGEQRHERAAERGEGVAEEAVRNRGAFAHLVATPAPAPLRGIRVHTVLVRADGDQLRRLVGGLRGRLVLIP
jgi:hypothetical protein